MHANAPPIDHHRAKVLGHAMEKHMMGVIEEVEGKMRTASSSQAALLKHIEVLQNQLEVLGTFLMDKSALTAPTARLTASRKRLSNVVSTLSKLQTRVNKLQSNYAPGVRLPDPREVVLPTLPADPRVEAWKASARAGSRLSSASSSSISSAIAARDGLKPSSPPGAELRQVKK